MGKNEIYKNAPLVETVFEIRFPGEPAVECKRDRFYEKVRDVYSKVLVPRAVEGKAMALEPYKFEREDGTYGIMLAINKISVYCKKYDGFKVFKEEVMKLLSIFGELFNIKKLNRTGLRYINIIPFIREGEIIPLNHYLNINLKLPSAIPSDFKNINIIFVSQTEGGSVTTRIEPAISQDCTQEVIILDFDYAKEGDLNFNLIDKYIEESHYHTKHLFEELITEEYRKLMRGEVV
ncbi:MAG: TIGR04255 family protein [Candidatus Omnitrophica bacterium]|nr:TIGR04255 family protein [Candidatus Omnitrophota bacterium]